MKTIKLPKPVQLVNYTDGRVPLKRQAIRNDKVVFEDTPPMGMDGFLEDVIFTDPALSMDEKSGKTRVEIRQVMRAVTRLRDTAQKACERVSDIGKCGLVDTMEVEDYDYDLVLGVIKNPKTQMPLSQLSQLESLFDAWEHPVEKIDAEKK